MTNIKAVLTRPGRSGERVAIVDFINGKFVDACRAHGVESGLHAVCVVDGGEIELHPVRRLRAILPTPPSGEAE